MAEEIRRSGRANKGHHTKNADALDEIIANPTQKTKGKSDNKKRQSQGADSSRPQSAQPSVQHEEEEEDAIYRCVCGDQREIRGREMIMCDRCEAWQHNKCLGLPDSSYWEDKTYLCEQCKPEDHAELLAAIARGEKPWNRKKGSKAPRPKFRPSDVGSVMSEATPEKRGTATPQPTQTPAHVPTATPTPAPAPVPVPVPVAAPPPAQEVRLETSGAHVAKPPKKVSPKSQPQSPVGEKRSHDTIAEKDAASSKRRKSSTHSREKSEKSSQHREAVASASGPTPSSETLPEKQRLVVEALRKQLSGLIKGASESRGYRIPDGDTPSSIATRLSLQIDHAAVLQYGAPSDNSSPYVLQIRRIISNTKTNTVLLDRLLDGSLSPADIAAMSAEEMASEDKQREYAAINEANEKQMILTEEPGPRLRKTHKGEEYVGEANEAVGHEFRQPEPRFRESVDEAKPKRESSPDREAGPVVELPEDVGRSTSLSIDTSSAQPPPQTDGVRRPSTTFDINSVFDKVRSPQKDQHNFIHRRQSSTRAQHTPHEGPVVDADIDRLLKDEDNDVEMTGYSADPTIVWRGSLEMQSSGSFEAVARFVAGGDFGQVIPWDQLLSKKLSIVGRIESHRGNDYIEGLSQANSHDVGVLAITPETPEGQAIFDHLFGYFHPRDRWGVVPTDKSFDGAMRDLYVIPIEPGGRELPRFLNLLEYCTIETPRSAPMILLALVAKLPETNPPPPAQKFEQYPSSDVMQGVMTQQTPGHLNGPPATGPSPSPLANPHGPQYSPMQQSFPPTLPPGYNSQPPPQAGFNAFAPHPQSQNHPQQHPSHLQGQNHTQPHPPPHHNGVMHHPSNNGNHVPQMHMQQSHTQSPMQHQHPHPHPSGPPQQMQHQGPPSHTQPHHQQPPPPQHLYQHTQQPHLPQTHSQLASQAQETYQRAQRIFGTISDSPVLRTMLSQRPDMDDELMQNLKAIMEKDPRAKNDMEVLVSHLFGQRQQEHAPPGQGGPGQSQGHVQGMPMPMPQGQPQGFAQGQGHAQGMGGQ